MFLRGSLDLVPVSLLAKPQLETPCRTQQTTVTPSPAGCPGKGHPRDTMDGGSKAFYVNQDRGTKAGQMSPVRKNFPQHAQDFTCTAKLTEREERYFLGPPRHALRQPRLGTGNSAKFLRQGKTLPSTHKSLRPPQN